MNKNFLYEYISVGLQQNSIPRDFKIMWEVFMTFKKLSEIFFCWKFFYLRENIIPTGFKKSSRN